MHLAHIYVMYIYGFIDSVSHFLTSNIKCLIFGIELEKYPKCVRMCTVMSVIDGFL